MKLRSLLVLVLVPLTLGACARKKPVDTPATPAAADLDAERARADAAARAEAERRAAEAGRAAEAARVRARLTEIVFFEFDSDRLTREAEERLRDKASILRVNPTIRLRIEGHADERGSTEYNLALGQRRAEAVRTFLGGFGVSAERLATISFGEERPLAEGNSESAWAQNRRAEFVVTAGEVTSIPGEVR
jgi:peptidoglycan-associated lipoprotein